MELQLKLTLTKDNLITLASMIGGGLGATDVIDLYPPTAEGEAARVNEAQSLLDIGTELNAAIMASDCESPERLVSQLKEVLNVARGHSINIIQTKINNNPKLNPFD